MSTLEQTWEALPPQIRAHPGIKALHRAALSAQPAAEEARPVAPAGWKCSKCHDLSAFEGIGDSDNWCSSCGACDAMRPVYEGAAPAPVALSEEQMRDIANGLNGVQPMLGQWERDKRLARAAIAEFCRINGITAPSAAAGVPNAKLTGPSAGHGGTDEH